MIKTEILIETFNTGRQVLDDNIMGRTDQDYKNFDIIEIGGLRYNSSWDAMMPTITKIFLIEEYGKNVPDTGMKLIAEVRKAYLTTELDKTYHAVVKFIEYYNAVKRS